MMLTVLAGQLITAAMVRFSPGFGVDERELDSRSRDVMVFVAIRVSR